MEHNINSVTEPFIYTHTNSAAALWYVAATIATTENQNNNNTPKRACESKQMWWVSWWAARKGNKWLSVNGSQAPLCGTRHHCERKFDLFEIFFFLAFVLCVECCVSVDGFSRAASFFLSAKAEKNEIVIYFQFIVSSWMFMYICWRRSCCCSYYPWLLLIVVRLPLHLRIDFVSSFFLHTHNFIRTTVSHSVSNI